MLVAMTKAEMTKVAVRTRSRYRTRSRPTVYYSQSIIAEYLGVASKGTIFNWIHDYPYGKNK